MGLHLAEAGLPVKTLHDAGTTQTEWARADLEAEVAAWHGGERWQLGAKRTDFSAGLKTSEANFPPGLRNSINTAERLRLIGKIHQTEATDRCIERLILNFEVLRVHDLRLHVVQASVLSIF